MGISQGIYRMAGASADKQTTPIRISAGDFVGDDVVVAALIGKTAEVDFDVWSAGGGGVLMDLGVGYTFVSGTGTLNMGVGGAGDYLIQLYNP